MNTNLALQDIKLGLKNWRIWVLLAWQDIRLRYRRSTLGPFWITLSMAVTIYTMGLLYGKLFKIDLKDYYPFLTTGMLAWSLISTIIQDATTTFIEAEHFIKQMKQSYCTFIFKNIMKNFIIFAHNIVVLVPIVIIFHIPLNAYSLLLIPGLLILGINAIVYSTILSILGTRFRDLTQIINSLIQIIFFLTPIMWSASVFPSRYQFILKLNPFAQLLDLLRAPLLGQAISRYAFSFSIFMAIFGALIAFFLFAKFRSRIVYWL